MIVAFASLAIVITKGFPCLYKIYQETATTASPVIWPSDFSQIHLINRLKMVNCVS